MLPALRAIIVYFHPLTQAKSLRRVRKQTMPLWGHLLCSADRTETRPSFPVFTFSPLGNALTPVFAEGLCRILDKCSKNQLNKTETQTETGFVVGFGREKYCSWFTTHYLAFCHVL